MSGKKRDKKEIKIRDRYIIIVTLRDEEKYKKKNRVTKNEKIDL